MKIDITYQGATAAYSHNRSTDNATKNNLAGNVFETTHKGQAVTLTVSDEMIHFQDDTAEFFSKDMNVQKADPSDIFSYRPQDQWLIFSQYLNDSEFFHSKNIDDIRSVEATLQQITEGLDSLTRTGINFFGGLKTELDSYEAKMELSSSSFALQLFSEKFLTGDVKKGFDQLIDQYVNHNKEKVINHQSLEEKFYAARSKIKPIYAERTSEQNRILSITNKLGQTIFSKEEIESFINSYSELFEGIKDEHDLSSALLKAKEQLLQFVTKGISKNDSDYQAVQDFISERSNDTFKRIEEYIKVLLK